MHADKSRRLVGGRNKTRVRHAERGKDMRAEIGIERLSGDGFDCAPDPVDVDAIFPAFARIENQRQLQRSELASHEGGHAGCGDIADQLRVPDLVAEAGCVGQQMAQRDRAFGRAQSWRARGVEALQDLRRGQFREHVADRLVELELALLDELHRRDRGHRLGHRRDAEHAVAGHCGAVDNVAQSKRALVQDSGIGSRQCDDTRHLFGFGGSAQGCIDAGG